MSPRRTRRTQSRGQRQRGDGDLRSIRVRGRETRAQRDARTAQDETPHERRGVAHAQIPGAHVPGFTIPPHFVGSETNTSVSCTRAESWGSLRAVAQSGSDEASPSRNHAKPFRGSRQRPSRKIGIGRPLEESTSCREPNPRRRNNVAARSSGEQASRTGAVPRSSVAP